ncbi:MAG TPA: hypothetical protein VFB43_06800 [Terracidiphilus sp.]|nr:hypothetical protein [Terracidiphilus sp.]
MPFDNGFNDRQAKSGPALSSSAEERFEDPGSDGGGNSMSVVGNEDVGFSIHAAGPKVKCSLNRQRLYSVADEVRKNLQHRSPTAYHHHMVR